MLTDSGWCRKAACVYERATSCDITIKHRKKSQAWSPWPESGAVMTGMLEKEAEGKKRQLPLYKNRPKGGRMGKERKRKSVRQRQDWR